MAKDINERLAERRPQLREHEPKPAAVRAQVVAVDDEVDDAALRAAAAHVVPIEVDRAQQPQSIGAFVVCSHVSLIDATTVRDAATSPPAPDYVSANRRCASGNSGSGACAHDRAGPLLPTTINGARSPVRKPCPQKRGYTERLALRRATAYMYAGIPVARATGEVP